MEFMDSIFIISCCYFQHSLSTRKEFNSILILNLWNVLHATLLSSVVSPTTPETKNIQLESEWCFCHQSLWLLLPLSTEYSALLLIVFLHCCQPSLCSSISDCSRLCHSKGLNHLPFLFGSSYATFAWWLANKGVSQRKYKHLWIKEQQIKHSKALD